MSRPELATPGPAYGPRVEPDGTQHARVNQAHDYDIETPLYRRQIGNGSITCRMLKAATPARRIIQLVAEYSDQGIDTMRVCQCTTETEEIRELARLEKIILAASRRPGL